MSEYMVIGNEYCVLHSTYYGWRLYRAWNTAKDHGKMLYFAVSPKNDLIRSKNLSGIKEAVRGADGYE